MFSIKVQTEVGGRFDGNAMTFDTHQEAVAYARNLAFRWTLVLTWRIYQGDEMVEESTNKTLF